MQKEKDAEVKLRKRHIFWIIIIGLILHLSLIFFDRMYPNHPLEAERAQDVDVYTERSRTILEGGVLYRDVYTEVPPGICYLLLPAYILGNSLTVYMLYFTLFNILSALFLYHFPLTENKILEFRAAILFITNPITLLAATIKCTDEPVCVLFFLIPIYFLLKTNINLAALSSGLGVIIKWIPGIFFPICLYKAKKNKERIQASLLFIIVIIVGFLPFYFLAPEDFWGPFDRYVGTQKTEGDSLLNILSLAFSLSIHPLIRKSVFLILIAAYIYTYKKNLNPLVTSTIIIIAFLASFTKLQYEYFIYLFGPLSFFIHNHRDKSMFYAVTFTIYAAHELKYSYAYFALIFSILTILLLISFTLKLSSPTSLKEIKSQ